MELVDTFIISSFISYIKVWDSFFFKINIYSTLFLHVKTVNSLGDPSLWAAHTLVWGSSGELTFQLLFQRVCYPAWIYFWGKRWMHADSAPCCLVSIFKTELWVWLFAEQTKTNHRSQWSQLDNPYLNEKWLFINVCHPRLSSRRAGLKRIGCDSFYS